MFDSSLNTQVTGACEALHAGGVIAYPTEYCFGLGCDPRNQAAVERLLEIKNRKAEQGVILIAADLAQVSEYANLDQVPALDRVISSWPGPNTWLLPSLSSVPEYVRGKHQKIAMRIPDNAFCLAMLMQFRHPVVSTSANRSGQKEHLNARTVYNDMGVECDFVVDFPVGGAQKASSIRDSLTGKLLR